MPLYEFRCDTCGEFEALRALAEFDNPMYCPTCNAIAQRIFCAPNINLNAGSLPRSSPEPRLVKQKSSPASPRYQSIKSGRPWAISHSPERL
ncbi:zinc ribbon domain-containing protein [Spirulina sp. 06S082]|uniref:FmdB family zinc ribbon protein n=1 Tax=Spirulina sp. 06S082 TaxID=3110248 RepID=UPI002B1F2EA9|nr:zinc ribbon domain-containing protein [Spirulina sp. 06S082]MEA5471989.1 zinc ribbon domain-containing protein [Spirulina sp. 06S082]